MFQHIITAHILHKMEALRLKAPSKTNALPNMSERDQALWPAFIDKYIDRIKQIKEPIRQWAQTIGWFDEFKSKTPAATLNKVIKKAKKTPKPSAKKLPLHLTKDAEKLWPEFWKKYSATVNKVPDLDKRWATAIAIFRNFALKRNVKPFEEGSKVSGESKEYLVKRFDSVRKKLFTKSKSILKQFKKTIGKRILKEKLTGINYNKKDKGYNITTTAVLSLNPNQTFGKKDVAQYFKDKGFTKSGKKYILKAGPHTITITPGDDSNKLNYNLNIFFTREQIKQLIGDAKDIEKALSIFVRKNIKDNIITNVIAKINIDRKLSENEEEGLNFVNEEDLNKDEAIVKYTAEYIQTLGDPVYQYRLAKLLIDKYGDNPSWNDLIDTPSLLDKDKISDMQDEEATDIENDI